MWAPQQAARARRRASRASNRRRGRRIRSGRLRTYYRDNGRGSSHAGAGRDGRLTVDGRPTRAKNRRKMMEARHFSGSNAFMECGTPAARAPRSGTVICVESNRSAGGHRINFTRFRTRREANTRRKLRAGIRSSVAHAVPMLSRLRVIETTGPGKVAPKRGIPDIGRS